MVQEYLFVDDKMRTEIEAYKPDKVITEFYSIDNSDCWIVSYTIPGENENGAKILSDINEYVMEKFSPTVLSNGSSAYFNRMLFPCINEFERKLRKLLYLKAALNRGDKAVENINGLESKDLGEIFTLMFTDDAFIKSVRTTVNDKTWAFTKDEIIESLKNIEETTKWDSLIGVDSVVNLKTNFVAVKNYRNDTMHAHNISSKTYKEAKKLFGKINEQLDEEIGKIIKIAEEEPEKMDNSQFNSELSLAIKELDLTQQLRELIHITQSPEMLAIRQQLSEISPVVSELRQQLGATNAFRTELADIIKSVQSPEITAIQKQLAELRDLTKIDK